MAYSDVFFTMLNLFSSFTDDNMMPQAITLHDKFIIILSQHVIFPLLTRYLSNKQKIKLLAHSQCNVRASKNAEQAFSTQ